MSGSLASCFGGMVSCRLYNQQTAVEESPQSSRPKNEDQPTITRTLLLYSKITPKQTQTKKSTNKQTNQNKPKQTKTKQNKKTKQLKEQTPFYKTTKRVLRLFPCGRWETLPSDARRFAQLGAQVAPGRLGAEGRNG